MGKEANIWANYCQSHTDSELQSELVTRRTLERPSDNTPNGACTRRAIVFRGPGLGPVAIERINDDNSE